MAAAPVSGTNILYYAPSVEDPKEVLPFPYLVSPTIVQKTQDSEGLSVELPVINTVKPTQDVTILKHEKPGAPSGGIRGSWRDILISR